MARDWKHLTAAYDVMRQSRDIRQNSRTTLVDWLHYRALRLRRQFLPHYMASPPGWRLWLRSIGAERTLPDFACIGPPKSGTSDLSSYLFQHPCILPPLSKEIRTPNTNRWRPYYPTVREKLQVERQHGKALSGYFLPSLHGHILMDNYHAAVPDAKIVLLLRNPVDLAHSHYKQDLVWAGPNAANTPYYSSFQNYVDVALDLFPMFAPSYWAGTPLLQTGIYYKAVELWMDRFGRSNVHIVRSEDFFDDTSSTVCDIHRFLDIPPIKPELHSIANASPVKISPMDNDTRQKLQVFYQPWNEKLYNLLGRDLGWG